MGVVCWSPPLEKVILKSSNIKTQKNNRGMELLLFLSAAFTLSTAAPNQHRHIRAAPAFENVCNTAAGAYSQAKSSGKSSKIASLTSAKTFYVEFFNSKIKGRVPFCENTVDAAQAKSVAGMVKYFNSASSNNLNVLTPICKATTVAFMTAKIEERGDIAAKLAAAAAYTPFILTDFGADPGEACIKSQDYISS